MKKTVSVVIPQIVAALLVVVLVYSPLSPLVASAYADDQPSQAQLLCESAGRVWNGESCVLPAPDPTPVSDTIPPVIAPQPDVSVEATSAEGAVVIYARPAVSDDTDSSVVAICTPYSGSTFAIGTTAVTCTATDGSNNSTTSTFNVIVSPMPAPENPTATSTTESATTTPETTTSTSPESTSSGQAATTTPDTTASTSSPQAATTTHPTPETTPSSTSTPSTTTEPEPCTTSCSSTVSGDVAPEESDTDNTDFEDIVNGGPLPTENDTRPVEDMSATTTESAAVDPLFMVASSTDGTGNKVGGTIFTGNATASTTVKNILNITRSNVDAPCTSTTKCLQSSVFKSETDNTADLTTADDTSAISGENNALGGEGEALLRTGNAVASAEVFNVANTNIFNSNGLVLFMNPMNGDGFDLRDTDLSYFFDESAGASPTQLGCTILTCLNSSALSVLNKNVATVKNTVDVRAITGRNTASSTLGGGVDMETGDAYAAANVLNLVNTNFINSSYLILAYNNFGDLNDDIVLPESSFFEQLFGQGASLPELNSSSYIVKNENDENFFGTTTASAITGENLATTTTPADGHGEVYTGNAYTSSNSLTLANQTRVGGSSVQISFRLWGEWSGTIKGLPDGMSWRATRSEDNTSWLIELTSSGGAPSSSDSAGVFNSSAFVASSTNVATVTTDVNVVAETGSNISTTENGVGVIRTGDAYAAANVVNMVNTNIVNRNMIFATFNIFGDWSGDISFGGHSPDLAVSTALVNPPNPIIDSSSVTYRFTVTNNGDVDAENVVLSTVYNKTLLNFTSGTSGGVQTNNGRNWNLGTIGAGASKDVTATMQVRARDIRTGEEIELPMTATVTS